GPNTKGASRVSGNVLFSPWLGDLISLALPNADSLGFISSNTAPFNSYQVNANPTGPNGVGVNLSIGDYLVTPNGPTFKVSYFGSGGKVTINGQSGAGFNTDAFTITNAAVTFTSGDAFNGATFQFNGAIARQVNAQGATNSFEVSSWTGAGTLTGPNGA